MKGLYLHFAVLESVVLVFTVMRGLILNINEKEKHRWNKCINNERYHYRYNGLLTGSVAIATLTRRCYMNNDEWWI